nr:MAG: ORF2 protein [Riboviria sp.]
MKLLIFFLPVVLTLNATYFLNKLNNAKIPFTSVFMRDYSRRGLKLTNGLLTEIIDQFRAYHVLYQRSDNTVKLARKEMLSFCCVCHLYSLNCPYCEYRNEYLCVYPLRNFTYLNDYLNYIYPKYLSLVSQSTTRSIATPRSQYFQGIYRVPTTFFQYCNPQSYRLNYDTMNSDKCVYVYHYEMKCPNITYRSFDDYCDWNKMVDVINGTERICYAPSFSNMRLSYSESGLCLNYHYVDIPALKTYLKQSESGWEPIPLGKTINKYYFSIPTSYKYNNFLRSLHGGHAFAHAAGQKILCNFLSDIYNTTFYDNSPSYFGDVLIVNPCKHYYPYNDTHDICSEVYENQYPYCEEYAYWSKSETGDSTFSVDINRFAFPFKNFTCNMFGKMGVCLFQDLLYDFGKNLTLNMSDIIGLFEFNITRDLTKIYDELLDKMGRNHTPNYYKSDKYQTPVLGSWLSWLFYDLIEPFFRMFVDIVLREIFVPLADAVVSFVMLLADVTHSIASNIQKVISKIADAFSRLLKSLIDLVVGILLVLECHILLLEYAILFVILTHFFKFSTVPAFIIVFVMLCIFGISRRSPSFIMYFIHQDYISVFNFTWYYQKTFSYDYSFTLFDGVYHYTYFLHNSTTSKIKIY